MKGYRESQNLKLTGTSFVRLLEAFMVKTVGKLKAFAFQECSKKWLILKNFAPKSILEWSSRILRAFSFIKHSILLGQYSNKT